MKQSIKDVFIRTVNLYPDNVAYSFYVNNKLVKVKYKEFYEDVLKLGIYINKLKLKNKRIAIIGKNCYQWAMSYVAIMCSGNVVVPLDKELTDFEISNNIKRADVDCIFYSNDLEEKVLLSLKDMKVKSIAFEESGKSIWIGKILEKDISDRDRTDFIDIKCDPNKLAALLFTSGTTRTYKIVMLSQHNLLSDVLMCNKAFHLNSEDKFFSLLPLHHMYECTAGFLLPLFLGASVHYVSGFRHIKKELLVTNPTIILCVPRIIEIFYESIFKEIKNQKKTKLVNIIMKLTNIFGKYKFNIKKKVFSTVHESFGNKFRFFICGGAPMNIEIAKYMTNLGIRIFEGYGITECSPIVSVNTFENNRLGSTGKVFNGLDVKIENPDNDGIGEVLVKGPTVMLGYYRNYKLNKKVFKKNYFNTEDLGYIDSDGYLYIVGRTKNLILGPNGENIFPEEIESLLLQSEIIKEVVISGKNFKNNVQLIANIVVNDDYLRQNSVRKNEVVDYIQSIVNDVNNKVAFYKRINSFNIMDGEFEKTSTLKIKR